jgi:type IV fimbrial biogenesis protein FimT
VQALLPRVHGIAANQAQESTMRIPSTARLQRGVSLIESMTVVTIASLAIGTTVPGVSSLRQRAELAGAAAQLETDVQFARGHAAALNRSVRLTLSEAAGATCYIVHTGSAGDCSCVTSGPAVCRGDAESLRAVSFAAQSPVQVRSGNRSIVFEPSRGTVTPTATLRVEGRDGRALHLVVNLMGRVRTCSPAGSVAGERSC